MHVMTGFVSKSQLTVLVEQHSDGYSAHVEAIEEILHVLADHRVGAVGLLVLHNPLSHGGNDVIVSVSDLNDGVCETEKIKLVKSTDRGASKHHALTFYSLIRDFFIGRIPVSELQELLETLHVPGCKETKLLLYVPPTSLQIPESGGRPPLPPSLPALNQMDRRSPQQVVGQQVDLLHDIGQSDRQLLSEEGEGRFLTRIF